MLNTACTKRPAALRSWPNAQALTLVSTCAKRSLASHQLWSSKVIGNSQRSFVLAWGKHGDSVHPGNEAKEYKLREDLLLVELIAVRKQVDKLLDQQQMLLGLLASQGSGAAASTSSAMLQHRPVAQPAAQLIQRAMETAQTSSPITPNIPSSRALSSSSTKGFTKPAPPPTYPSPFSEPPPSVLSADPAIASISAAMAAVNESDVLSAEFEALLASSSKSRAGSNDGSSSNGNGNGSSTTDAEPSVVAAAENMVETKKAPPGGNPPELSLGDDDIYWMAQLHERLEAEGFFPGDEDMEGWFFGDHTLNAVMAYQASMRLPETGFVDSATWSALLGQPVVTASEAAAGGEETPSASSSFSSTITTTATSASSLAVSDGAPFLSTASSTAVSSSSTSTSGSSSSVGSSSSSGGRQDLKAWPVLMEMDGGREVHALQVALMNAGYYSGEDDMRWWMFGTSTQHALRMFQGCNGLPESGVADKRTWLSLLGEHAQPNDMYEVVPADSDEDQFTDDLSETGRVWLLGEGRWERK